MWRQFPTFCVKCWSMKEVKRLSEYCIVLSMQVAKQENDSINFDHIDGLWFLARDKHCIEFLLDCDMPVSIQSAWVHELFMSQRFEGFDCTTNCKKQHWCGRNGCRAMAKYAAHDVYNKKQEDETRSTSTIEISRLGRSRACERTSFGFACFVFREFSKTQKKMTSSSTKVVGHNL